MERILNEKLVHYRAIENAGNKNFKCKKTQRFTSHLAVALLT